MTKTIVTNLSQPVMNLTIDAQHVIGWCNLGKQAPKTLYLGNVEVPFAAIDLDSLQTIQIDAEAKYPCQFFLCTLNEDGSYKTRPASAPKVTEPIETKGKEPVIPAPSAEEIAEVKAELAEELELTDEALEALTAPEAVTVEHIMAE